MRNQLKIVFSALAVLATLGLSSTVHGIPAYARQTGLECGSCHASAGFPALNTFGQAFKAGGYSDGNDDNFMGDGESLSIPKALNLSIVAKLRDKLTVYSKAVTGPGGDTYTMDNKFNLPDEIAFISGGRIAQNVGYFAEIAGGGPDGNIIGNFKMVFAPQLGPVKLGIVPFYTNGLGAAFAFETLSTANVENIRVTEGKGFSSAQEAVDWGGGAEAAGVGIYVWHPMGFIAYSPFVTTANTSGGDLSGADLFTAGFDSATFKVTDGLAHYIRVAVTPSFGGMDLAVGFTYKTGNSMDADFGGTGVPIVTAKAFNYMAIDAQFMATLGIPLTFVVTYASDSNTKVSAFAVAVDGQLIQDKLNLVIGYRHDLTSGSTGTLSNIGGAVKFFLAKNLRLSVDITKNLGTATGEGDLTVLPMIFTGF